MFEISQGPYGEVQLVVRLDAAQCDKALKFLDAREAPQVVDLTRLEYVSSAGLGVLLKTQKRAVAAGRPLRLVNPNKHIHDILRYAGFDRIFEVVVAGS